MLSSSSSSSSSSLFCSPSFVNGNELNSGDERVSMKKLLSYFCFVLFCVRLVGLVGLVRVRVFGYSGYGLGFRFRFRL